MLKRFAFITIAISISIFIACGLAVATNTSRLSKDSTLRDATALMTPLVRTESPEIVISSDCLQVFYDRPKTSPDQLGRTYAIMLANLLGHFPRYVTSISPIESYRPGQLEKCKANFYIGTTYENHLPPVFSSDVRKTKNKIVWIGDSFWKLNKNLENTFGVKFVKSEQEDKSHPDDSGNPSFYRDVLYKGEVFSKLSEKGEDGLGWDAEPNIAHVEIPRSSIAKTLVSIRQSATRLTIPWAVQRKNYFLFTEIPFSFVHEGDRYFVFADLLFDILGEKPRREHPIAIVRFEDIHARTDVKYVRQALSIAKDAGVQPVLSLIPIYRDPLHEQESLFSIDRPLGGAGELLDVIKSYQDSGGVMAWHGVTHQYQDRKNPESGRSGEDYEFWDVLKQQPIENDSTSFIMKRLKWGAEAFAEAGLRPHTWITPHYEASGLDTMIFGRVFNWTVGRQVYFDFKRPLGANASNLDLIKFDQSPNEMIEQMFPYEIYGDFYQQKIIPEDLGNVQLGAGMIGRRARRVDDILADAKRLSVLRDVWGSFFYHPFLLALMENQPKAEVRQKVDLKRLLSGIKDLGYVFINLDDFMKTNNQINRRPIQDLNKN
jgi:uncharacterized protein YdaL